MKNKQTLNKIKGYWKNRNYWQKGAIIGIIFGLLAYLGCLVYGMIIFSELLISMSVLDFVLFIMVLIGCGFIFGFFGFLIGLVKKGLWKKLVLTVLIVIAIIVACYIIYYNFISEERLFRSNIPFEVEKKVLKKTVWEEGRVFGYNISTEENYILVEHIAYLQDEDSTFVSVWYNEPNEIIITEWTKEEYMSSLSGALTFYDVLLKETVGPLEKGTYTVKVVSSGWQGIVGKGLKPHWQKITQTIENVTI